MEYGMPLKQSHQRKKRALCDWTLAKLFKGFLHCSRCEGVQGTQTQSWSRQMDQMTPPAPLEHCCVWMLESINLWVIFDLQLAFVFNFLYIVKPCSIQQDADLAVLGAHQVICLAHTLHQMAIFEINLSQSFWADWNYKYVTASWEARWFFNIPILDTPMLKFLWVNFQRTK